MEDSILPKRRYNFIVAIITFAINDALYGKGEIQHEAITWLMDTEPDNDFYYLCEGLKLDPSVIQEKLRKKLNGT